jgi:hypothetical protein
MRPVPPSLWAHRKRKREQVERKQDRAELKALHTELAAVIGALQKIPQADKEEIFNVTVEEMAKAANTSKASVLAEMTSVSSALGKNLLCISCHPSHQAVPGGLRVGLQACHRAGR